MYTDTPSILDFILYIRQSLVTTHESYICCTDVCQIECAVGLVNYGGAYAEVLAGTALYTDTPSILDFIWYIRQSLVTTHESYICCTAVCQIECAMGLVNYGGA